MVELQGQYFDGQTSEGKPAKLLCTSSSFELQTADNYHCYTLDEIKLQPRLANINARFELNDGAVFEAADQPGLDDIYKQLHQGALHQFIHKLENNLVYIVPTLVVAVVVMWALIQFGIPQFAKSVAYQIPVEYESRMGKESLAIIDKAFCKPSKLTAGRQAFLRSKMLTMLGNPDAYQVEFRYCEAIGANALALPSGIIIFTDDMVNLAKHDEELLGVFAHEVAHVDNRHTLRHILQDSITGLLIVVLTGDVGSASSIAAAVPTVLLQTKFSRDFEREADIQAAGFMVKHNLRPVHLANILERLEKEYGDGEESSGFLSTHPLTKERVKYLTNYNNK
ncbi:MAG: M48 family metallopeptidase [Gammaproteobacteria bacterium]